MKAKSFKFFMSNSYFVSISALPSAQSGEKRDSESKESPSAAKSKGQQSQEKNDDEKAANEK